MFQYFVSQSYFFAQLLLCLLLVTLTACTPRPAGQLLAELPPFRLESQVLDPEFLWQLEQKLTANGATLAANAAATLTLLPLERRERRQLVATTPRLQEVEARYQLTVVFHWDADPAADNPRAELKKDTVAQQRLESYQRYLLEPERPLAAKRREAEQNRRALTEMTGQILQFLATLTPPASSIFSTPSDVAKPQRP